MSKYGYIESDIPHRMEHNNKLIKIIRTINISVHLHLSCHYAAISKIISNKFVGNFFQSPKSRTRFKYAYVEQSVQIEIQPRELDERRVKKEKEEARASDRHGKQDRSAEAWLSGNR